MTSDDGKGWDKGLVGEQSLAAILERQLIFSQFLVGSIAALVIARLRKTLSQLRSSLISQEEAFYLRQLQ